MKQLICIISLAMLLVGFSITASSAGVKKIEPEQFMVFPSTINPYFIGPTSLYANSSSGGVTFFTIVKLPVGKVIKKIIFYYNGYSSTNSPNAGAALWRIKMGGYPEFIGSIYSSDAVSKITPYETIMITSSYRKIKSGYKYWVEVHSANWNSPVYGVKITYQ